MSNTQIVVGSKVRVEKGCKSLGITKGSMAEVIETNELGPDYSHSVRVTLRFINFINFKKDINLYARHPNRLSDAFVNLNNGDPTKKITVVVR